MVSNNNKNKDYVYFVKVIYFNAVCLIEGV